MRFPVIVSQQASSPAPHFGRIYLLSVLVSAAAGLYLAFPAFGGLPARIGFGLLGVLWLATGWIAYRRIRQGDVQMHRRWIIRNYALTFSAVTLRLWLLLLVAFGYDFPEAYPAVAWLAWVPNLLVAELIIGTGKFGAIKPKPVLAS